MERIFRKRNEDDPKLWDYFTMRTRWNRSTRQVDVYMITREGGGEPVSTRSPFGENMDYHGFISETTEELLDDGWQET